MTEHIDNAIADRILTVIQSMFNVDPIKTMSLFDLKISVSEELAKIVPTYEIKNDGHVIGLFHILNALMTPVQTEKHKGCGRISIMHENDKIRIVKTEELE